MRVLRRYVFPVAWLAIFAVIAVALFKLAFVDGMRAEAVTEHPTAQLVTPSVPATLGTVTNVVQIEGSVASDPAVAVRSTAEGTVNFLFVDAGANVSKGDPLFQVQKLVEPDPAGLTVEVDPDEEPAPPPAPVYTYVNVVAPAAGKLTELTVLVDQQVSVGADAATISPGTFSVTGTLTADQQFRLLDRPSSATVTVNGGPAPFDCKAVTVGEAPDGGPDQAQVAPAAIGPFGPEAPAAAATGTVNCAVPADVKVFAGLGATIDITAGTAENVVVVPTTAVQGSVDTGLVWLVEDDGGAPVERSVTLGLNDGMQVQILDGLAEGDMVLQFIPGAPGEQMMPGMEGDFGMIGG
ncbi:efflux RND transporter periplasmic adaptor subunit [Arthrobacter sulfonylureivorans]|uniref:efflux RND transporter periplasmic adaptor subunit n=1 Tax=Arthrobacter sulfonylureivorans TaxID=2486855 RepID=UPI0039E68B68